MTLKDFETALRLRGATPIPTGGEVGKSAAHGVGIEFAYDEGSGLYIGRAEIVREDIWDVFFGDDR